MTGVLSADFSAFEAAAQKATTSIKGMELGAAKAESALSDMSDGAVGPTNTLRESFGQVDQVLSASGVNIGKYARGLVEIGDMAGKTASEIGWLATGASIFGALMAGWQFGTWIAGWTGLAEAVEKYADSLTNLPAEVAAAQQDTINLAFRNGSGVMLSYTDAIAFNSVAIQHQIAMQTDWVAVLAAAQREVRNLSDAEKDGIAIMQQAGATTEQITTRYQISALALKELAIQQREAAKAAQEHTKKQEELAAAQESAYQSMMKRRHAEEAREMEAALKQQHEQEDMFGGLDIQARLNRQAAERAREAEEAAAEERRIAANQADIDRILAAGAAPQMNAPTAAPRFGGTPGFASVMNSPPSIVINANNSFFNNHAQLNELARLVEDAIAQRSGLTNTFSRR